MRAQGLPSDQPYSSPARVLAALQNPGKQRKRVSLSSREISAQAHAWHEEAKGQGLLVDRCCS
jgi:hypothetical protein